MREGSREWDEQLQELRDADLMEEREEQWRRAGIVEGSAQWRELVANFETEE